MHGYTQNHPSYAQIYTYMHICIQICMYIHRYHHHMYTYIQICTDMHRYACIYTDIIIICTHIYRYARICTDIDVYATPVTLTKTHPTLLHLIDSTIKWLIKGIACWTIMMDIDTSKIWVQLWMQTSARGLGRKFVPNLDGRR
jgi:hypothetical protein